MDEESEVLRGLKSRFAEALTETKESGNELHLTVAPEPYADLCRYLREEPSLAFDYPADLMARDTGEQIILWVRLVSMQHNRTAILHIVLPREAPTIASITPIWPGMNWHERESFDLFGVRFVGHPDEGDPAQMRILLPEDWEGHPFRKDYTPVFSGDPLHGPQERN